jgi:predicted AlkP superfamily phosphohydrolase/phosphomutase/Tfp pilus assembly protein PilF
MGAVMYVLASLFLPSSRRLILGVDKQTGDIRLVRQNVTFLPPHRFYRLSFEKREGSAQRDGLVTITSKEGVPVTITYRLRFSIAGRKLADARRLVNDGWSAWIRARVGEAVSAVTAQMPIEDLLSPSSRFNQQRDPLRRLVSAHLARSGLNVTAFMIMRIEPDRDALLRYKRAELRRSARGVAGRVAIFGIDGADWDLIQELIFDGRLPNIAALTRGGTSAALQTIQPTVSPLLWTSVATGVTPDRHGVIDFLSNSAPADSYARHSPALWEIAEGFGRPSAVVNWWTDWPPSSTNAIVYDAPVDHLRGAIYPQGLADKIRGAEVPVETIGYPQVRRFIHISEIEYRNAVNSGNAADPVNVMRSMLAKTWSDHRVAINLYREHVPLLFMMNYEATDVVNHIAGPYHPPYREGISQVSYRKFWPTVANFYSEVDRLLGEWLQVLPQDTTVILMSAHGFRWGQGRPRTQPIGRAALDDHRNPGVFIAYGNHVAPSRAGHSISIYDIAPTVLAILGLPPSQEMPGQLASWAVSGIQPLDAVRVVSYSEYFSERPVASALRTNVQEYKRNLQAIGHLLGPSRGQPPMLAGQQPPQQTFAPPLPPQQWGAYAYYNNLGIELRRQGKTREAIEAFQKAIDVNPSRPTPYLNMAMTLFDRQQYTAAEDVFLMAVNKGLPNGEQWIVDFAALFREHDLVSRAAQLLYKGKQLFPQSYLIAANLGSALAQAGRYTEGLPELERALGLQPTSTLALNNLGVLYAKRQDYGRALDFWNRSLSINPRQPEIRVARDAAQSRL